MNGSSRNAEARSEFWTRIIICALVGAVMAAFFFIVERVGFDRILDAVLPTVAEGAIPPQEVKFVYEGGGQLEDKIRDAKRQMRQSLAEAGCQQVQFTIWREGEDIFIVARCLD